METKVYKVTKIEGEYATITDEDSGEELFIMIEECRNAKSVSVSR